MVQRLPPHSSLKKQPAYSGLRSRKFDHSRSTLRFLQRPELQLPLSWPIDDVVRPCRACETCEAPAFSVASSTSSTEGAGPKEGLPKGCLSPSGQRKHTIVGAEIHRPDHRRAFATRLDTFKLLRKSALDQCGLRARRAAVRNGRAGILAQRRLSSSP